MSNSESFPKSQHTMRAAVNAVKQQYQVNPIVASKPVERVPLSTPVTLYDGVEAIICGHSTADCNNYQVCYFDRKYWTVRRRWLHHSKFEVCAANKTATAA